MDEPPLTWDRLARDFKRIRRGSGYSQSDIGIVGHSQISRYESGKVELRRDVVAWLAEHTGAHGLLEDFDELKRRGEMQLLPTEAREFPPLYSIARATNVTTTVDIGDVVLLFEERTVLPLDPPVSCARLGFHFDPTADGPPEFSPVAAYRAEVVRQWWQTPSTYLVDLKFPETALIDRDIPYTFGLRWTFTSLQPVIGAVFAGGTSRYSIFVHAQQKHRRFAVLRAVPLPMLPDVLADFWGRRGEGAEPVDFDSLGEASVVFPQPLATHFYGVAWSNGEVNAASVQRGG